MPRLLAARSFPLRQSSADGVLKLKSDLRPSLHAEHLAKDSLGPHGQRLFGGQAKGLASLQGTTTAASGSVSAVSLASEEAKGGLAHLVGEMDAELRVELNARLRGLTADLKGEIMSAGALKVVWSSRGRGCGGAPGGGRSLGGLYRG